MLNLHVIYFLENQSSISSPLDRFKDTTMTVDETALLLHTEVRFIFQFKKKTKQKKFSFIFFSINNLDWTTK